MDIESLVIGDRVMVDAVDGLGGFRPAVVVEARGSRDAIGSRYRVVLEGDGELIDVLDSEIHPDYSLPPKGGTPMPAPVRSDRLTTVAGLLLIAAGAWTGWLAWRDSEAKHRAAARDRAALHAELQTAEQARADMERRATRLERNDVEFRAFATRAHGETHRMLRELIGRAKGGPPSDTVR